MTLKLPTDVDTELSNSIDDYLKNFPYRITVRFGKTYSPEFKEFNRFCESMLGVKYKDWFLVSGANNYTLMLKDNKKAVFLSLKYSEVVDRSLL